MGLGLDNKLTSKKHIKDKLNKSYFGVGKIKRLRDILLRDSLLTIYISFIRPHLDYGDVIYDKPNNDSFSDNIEQLQCKACLAITEVIQGTSRECLYNELGLESLSSRSWCRKLCAIYKLLSTQCPTFTILYHLVKAFMIHTRNRDLFPIIKLIVSNILSFQILYLKVATFARNARLGAYCSFQKQTSIFYKT